MMQMYRAFPVKLPSGERYWTVLDSGYRPVPDADDWLLHLRMGLDRAESTTETYARALTLYFQWCAATDSDWASATSQLGRFVYWLRYHDPKDANAGTNRVVRNARRINVILAAVREFFRHEVGIGRVDEDTMLSLFDVAEDYTFPTDFREGPRFALHARPRHRLSEPAPTVDTATDDEVLGLLHACRNARDRFIVLTMWRAGVRRGELTGIRLEDVHFVQDATSLGCSQSGEHLHVRRRVNVNGASAKSRRARVVPVDHLVVQAYDQYVSERDTCGQAGSCDFLLVNLFRAPFGAPMRPQALNELFADLSDRAKLSRQIHPHQLRHGFATNVMAAGGTLDEVRELLGHAFITSTQVYLQPSPERLRAAVERVVSPRPRRDTEEPEL